MLIAISIYISMIIAVGFCGYVRLLLEEKKKHIPSWEFENRVLILIFVSLFWIITLPALSLVFLIIIPVIRGINAAAHAVAEALSKDSEECGI